MNAYELSDEIEQAIEEKEFMTSASEKWHKEIANMLRSQSELIASLQESNRQQADQLIREDSRIAELEKEKQSYKYDPETGEPLIDGYPLYSGLPTPQTKPLSDEEIEKLWFENVNPAFTLVQIKKFAKAIEERHGIK